MRPEDKKLLSDIQEIIEPSDDRFVNKQVKPKESFILPIEEAKKTLKPVEEPKRIPVNQPELSNEAREFNRQMKISHTLAKSTIVPMHFRGKPDDIFACVMLGSELGFQPMMSLNSIVIIQGQATLKAQTMLAVVKSKCKSAIISIIVDEEKKIAVVKAQRDSDDPGYTATWDMAKAKNMGLSSKDNWIKQPTTMLRWRAVSEAVRMVFADVLMGIYSTEEFQDIEINTDKEKALEATKTFSV